MNETNVETGVDAADSDVTESDPPLGVGVVTVASNRTLESDAAGEAIGSALEEAGHEIATREHVGPNHDRVQSIVLRVIERGDVDLVVTAGATSVEPDDVAIEAIEPLLDRELPAFGDLFTMLAYESVGTRVVAARTLAGVAESTPVFSLPGTPRPPDSASRRYSSTKRATSSNSRVATAARTTMGPMTTMNRKTTRRLRSTPNRETTTEPTTPNREADDERNGRRRREGSHSRAGLGRPRGERNGPVSVPASRPNSEFRRREGSGRTARRPARVGGGDDDQDEPRRAATPVRRRALRDGKTVYMAVPRLRDERCFLELDPDVLEDYDEATTVSGSAKHGVQVGPDALAPIDLIVAGSVAAADGGRIGGRIQRPRVRYLSRTRSRRRDHAGRDDRPRATTRRRRPRVRRTRRPDGSGHHARTDDPSGRRRAAGGIDWRLLDERRLTEIPILSRLRKRQS